MKLVSVDLFMTVLGPGCCVGLSLAALRGGPSLGSGSSPRGLLCWGRGLWGLWAPHRRGSSAGGAGSGACGLLTAGAPLLGARALGPVDFSSCGSWALERRLSGCGSRASLLRGLGDLPGPGIKPTALHWQVGSLPPSHLGNPG